MDLNQSYSQHQQLLMRAAASPSPSIRARHLGMARACAMSISDYQRAEGAAAACGWGNSTVLPGHAFRTETECFA